MLRSPAAAAAARAALLAVLFQLKRCSHFSSCYLVVHIDSLVGIAFQYAKKKCAEYQWL
jgi:hypothetical protein